MAGQMVGDMVQRQTRAATAAVQFEPNCVDPERNIESNERDPNFIEHPELLPDITVPIYGIVRRAGVYPDWVLELGTKDRNAIYKVSGMVAVEKKDMVARSRRHKQAIAHRKYRERQRKKYTFSQQRERGGDDKRRKIETEGKPHKVHPGSATATSTKGKEQETASGPSLRAEDNPAMKEERGTETVTKMETEHAGAGGGAVAVAATAPRTPTTPATATPATPATPAPAPADAATPAATPAEVAEGTADAAPAAFAAAGPAAGREEKGTSAECEGESTFVAPK